MGVSLRIVLVLSLFLALSSGKKERKNLRIHNCAEENGPFKNVSRTRLSYTIVTSNSSKWCMHYVWSTVKNLALHVAYTPQGKLCQCSASNYSNNSYPNDHTIAIPGLESNFSLTVVFTRLVEFNATKKNLAGDGLNQSIACNNNTSAAYQKNNYSSIDLGDNLQWKFFPGNATFVGTLDKNGTKFEDLTRFSIRTAFPEFEDFDRLSYFPKAKFTENSTVVDVISENYPFKYNGSRVALEMIVIHGKNVKNGSINLTKTSDDEYTPSVFSTLTYSVVGKNQTNASMVGYTQWKPISYQSSGRKSTSSQQVVLVSATNATVCDVHALPEGLATALFGSNVSSGEVGNVTRWFLAFGTSGDDTYLNPAYNTWTMVVGYGQVPKDSYSSVIIITIIVGVGVPAVLVILGGIYVFIRKKPWQNVQRLINRSGRGYTRL